MWEKISKISRIFSLLVLLFFLEKPVDVYADENFDVSYNVFYRFLESGNALVTQTTTLLNKKTNLYATEFEMVISGRVVGSVSGFDKAGKLDLTSEKLGENKTKIQVKFNQKAVGIGNQLTFSINYELAGLTNVIGRVKEITVPKPSEASSLKSYEVRISVPKIFGPVAYVKPAKSFDTTENSYIFSFDIDQAKKGIMIGFGEVAYFQFKIKYHLKNDSFITRRTEIAIPPDTAYQQVFYSSIKPLPVDVVIDADGNYLAIFDLIPKQSVEVEVLGNALVFSFPRSDFVETSPSEKHLFANKYWEVDDQKIKKIAEGLNDPLDIYNYVVSKLKYDYSRVNAQSERFGAKKALEKLDNAICMEFTDLFIALARAKGIPAREINGYSYTSDEYLKPLSLVVDVLHAWPEYWDLKNKRWMPVDPTWANTTGGLDYFHNLDFYHLVFVRKGISSTYPLVAGSYRSATSAKDVEVNLKTDFPEIPAVSVSFDLALPKKIIAGDEQNLTLTVKNNGGVARYNVPIKTESKELAVKFDQEVIDLPPYAVRIVYGKLITQRKIWGEALFKIFVGDETKVFTIAIEPREILYLAVYLVLFFLLFISNFVVVRKYVFKRKIKKNS